MTSSPVTRLGSLMQAQRSRWAVAFCFSLLGATTLWLAIAAVSPGYVADMHGAKLWTAWLSERGVASAYASEELQINYPPVNLYLWAAVGHFYRTWIDSSFDLPTAFESQLLTWLFKLPAVFCQLVAGVVVFVLVRRRHGERLAWLAGTLLLFNPAAIYDIAHWGQSDSVPALLSLLSLAALSAGSWAPAGALIALAALSKQASWILLPLIATIAWQYGGRRALARCGLGGTVALLVVLAPFIAQGTLGQLARLREYMDTYSLASRAISANAHNIWWLPTLARGRFIDDLEPLVGPISFRWVAVGLVGIVLLLCLVRLARGNPRPDLYLLAATLCAGWFFFTPRAHENHSFFVLPSLAVAWPSQPYLFRLYVLASAALLGNMALEDPYLVGLNAWAGFTGLARPDWLIALTVANVVMFAALFVGLAKASGLFTALTMSAVRLRSRTRGRPSNTVEPR